ncbi:CAP domain-containing protein [Bacillus sp. JJ1532]|uniref:CAP domain-containing protein n=1 Tax=unclassified Bacillus (in: firmicutes) TaxID=185979 RepID=UPI002FFF837D
MINKKMGILLTSTLMLGLVACNTDTNNGNKPGNGNDNNISSMTTTMSSDNYPHTRAVLTQDAKYQFTPLNPGEDVNFQAELPQLNYGQAPIQQQDQAGQPEPNWNQRQAAQPPNYGQAQPQQNREFAKAPAQQQAPTQQQRQTAEGPGQQPAPAQKGQAQTQAPQNISQAAQQVIDLTNAQRRQNGLSDLKADTQLSGVAQKKSEDMQQNNYFSHTSPNYGSPFDMMRDFGVTYTSAGENIAQGQQTPQEVVQAWMNSEGHRKNILSNNFTHIGVGFEQNGKHWTQMFIGK